MNVSWVVPRGCFPLLSKKHKILGGGKKAKVLWYCLVLPFLGHLAGKEQSDNLFIFQKKQLKFN